MGSFRMREQRLTLPVSGMSCVNCAANIHKTLEKLDGVTEINVNFAAEQALVAFDSEKIGLDKIIEKIVDLGFRVVSAEREMPVTGMSCANCAANIEKTLNKEVPGVIKASVNFASERLFVAYLPSEIAMDGIVTRVKELGFDLIVAEEGMDETDVEEIIPYADPQTRTFLVKAALPFINGLYPGMFGKLRIPVLTEKVVVIPANALRKVGQLELVRAQDPFHLAILAR